jgi:heat shock protein HtpX
MFGEPEPVLIYNRIDGNRYRTWLLVSLVGLVLIPFVAGISYTVSAVLVWRIRSETRHTRAAIRADVGILRELEGSTRTEWNQRIEADLERKRQKLEKLEASDRALTLRIMPVFGCGLIAVLVMLFWGIASSPTSKLLVQAGAHPAGDDAEEAKRLLENLAIGAGLPAPKLYVIDSSAPNAFAAGMDPEHAVVAVTSGALALFTDKRELEGVLAHELSHIGNHDIRLNTIVASIGLFLRIPYLMLRREISSGRWQFGLRRGFRLWELALTPIGIYILFVAPILAAVIRAAVSREREFLADADATLLTRYPEGLLRALAKIGGAGSAVPGSNPAFAHFYFADPAAKAAFTGNLFSTHPPLSARIERLIAYQGQAALTGLEEAVHQGKQYTRDHPSLEMDHELIPGSKDELAALHQGNLMGRVCRVVSDQSVPVYNHANTHSEVVARVKPGSLLVLFDDPGRMRQVNTPGQTFGYLERGVKLIPVNHLIPDEVYDPKLLAAAEAALPPLSEVMAPSTASATSGLSMGQLVAVVGFGSAVFAGMLMLLLVFGK